ncbi:alpha/beta hydrolase [Chitinophaga sp.]|uniref:alpha/beta hydrolase n=1 Tax=Chitinophaga sp. TaxID=1869181 RepID=UPI0031DE4012
MEILPQVQEVLNYIQSIDVSHIEDKWQAGRAFYEKFIPLAGEEETLFTVENKRHTRIYRPAAGILPALIYFHGGWFNAGSLDTHDRPLRQLANQAGVIVISVDYRLAPEYPFPHGLNDCIDTTAWILQHAAEMGIDPLRIAVAGDSAGGALATAVAGRFPELKCQVLIYPVTDSSLTSSSWKEFAEGPNLTLAGAIEAWEYYATDKVKAAPIFNNDLSRMPDAFIITAEYDPLRDEAIAYGEKLRQAHVQVTEKLYPKMIHGFFQMGGVIDDGRAVIAEIAKYIRYKLIINHNIVGH